MKRRGWISAALFVSIIAVTINACKKDNVNLPYREYRLYNYSSGSAVDAGFSEFSNCLTVIQKYTYHSTRLIARRMFSLLLR